MKIYKLNVMRSEGVLVPRAHVRLSVERLNFAWWRFGINFAYDDVTVTEAVPADLDNPKKIRAAQDWMMALDKEYGIPVCYVGSLGKKLGFSSGGCFIDVRPGMGRTFVHEMGHVFGLQHRTFGIMSSKRWWNGWPWIGFNEAEIHKARLYSTTKRFKWSVI